MLAKGASYILSYVSTVCIKALIFGFKSGLLIDDLRNDLPDLSFISS
jgi:hypothetical protein